MIGYVPLIVMYRVPKISLQACEVGWKEYATRPNVILRRKLTLCENLTRLSVILGEIIFEHSRSSEDYRDELESHGERKGV